MLNRLAGPGREGPGRDIVGDICVNVSAGRGRSLVPRGSEANRRDLEIWSTLAENVCNCHIRGHISGQRRRSHSQPPDTIADVREPPGPHPAAFPFCAQHGFGASDSPWVSELPAKRARHHCGEWSEFASPRLRPLIGRQTLHAPWKPCCNVLCVALSRWRGRIAQLVEQLTLNQRVQGSNPCAPTKSQTRRICITVKWAGNASCASAAGEETLLERPGIPRRRV